MSYEDTAGLGVLSRYGAPGTQKGVAGGGEIKSYGSVKEITVYIDGEDFNGAVSYDTPITIPAGSSVLGVSVCEVTDAFTLGNADNDIFVGTNGSEGTNFGFQILNPAATGTTVDDPGGTWAAPLAADTVVGVLVSGTTAAASAGKAKVVIRYSKI